MVKILKDIVVYLPNDKEFVFRKDYCYMSEYVKDKLVIYSIDKMIKIELDKYTDYYLELHKEETE